MNWQRLSRGSYAGKTLPEVMFQVLDPDHVLDGLEKGEFCGRAQDEAAELRRRASQIRIDRDAAAYYHVRGGSYCGLAIVPRSSADRAEREPHVAARTDGYLDLTVLKRIAPQDKLATVRLMQAFEYHCLDDGMTLARFFEDPGNFLPGNLLCNASGRRAA